MKIIIFITIALFSAFSNIFAAPEDCIPNQTWTNGTVYSDNYGFPSGDNYPTDWSSVDYKSSGTNVIVDWSTFNNTSPGGWVSDKLVKEDMIKKIALGLTNGNGTASFYYETKCYKEVRAYIKIDQTVNTECCPDYSQQEIDDLLTDVNGVKYRVIVRNVECGVKC